MNLPNKITMLRVIMIPFFAFFMLTDVVGNSKYIAVAIFIIASLTDTLDGFIARKYNLVSNFGKFMDPLADKLLVSTALICFVSVPDNPMPVWGVIVIISREFIISGFRLVAANEGIVLAASWWGKIKTTVQMVMSVLLIVNFDGEVIDIIENIFIYAAIALTVISLADYLIKNWKVLDDREKCDTERLTKECKVIVVGGGAAGIMAAISAAESGDSVLLIEKNEKLGKKIYITGKGRCNITNDSDVENLLKNVRSNPKFLYSAFYTFDSYRMMDFLESEGLKIKTERGNRVFPESDKSSDVIRTLKKDLKKEK